MLKEYQKEVIKPGFKIGKAVPVHNYDTKVMPVNLDFGKPEEGPYQSRSPSSSKKKRTMSAKARVSGFEFQNVPGQIKDNKNQEVFSRKIPVHGRNKSQNLTNIKIDKRPGKKNKQVIKVEHV